MKKTLATENVIVKEMQLNGYVTLKGAMKILDMSEASVRRVFTRLERKGLGIRSHGKISLPDSSYSFYRYETSEELYVKEKKRIAREAINLLSDGDTVFLDSGTTVCFFSVAIREAVKQNLLKNLKIFTNSYTIISILNDCAIVNLIGGAYRPNRKDFCGYMAEKSINECHFDKCVLGTDGFKKDAGFSTTDFESAKICETAIKNSDKVIILMDFHKYNKSALVNFSKGDDVSVVVTDSKITTEAKIDLMKAGITVRIAE